MENYYKASTTKTPEIDFRITGSFKVRGNSYMENPIKFYKDITDWLKQFLSENDMDVHLDVQLIYINTSSTKCILTLMNLINNSVRSKLQITWKYQIDDGEILELGEDLEKIVKVKFDYKGV